MAMEREICPRCYGRVAERHKKYEEKLKAAKTKKERDAIKKPNACNECGYDGWVWGYNFGRQ